jgi:Holliday junction resolvase RusA-like endonuclease
MTGNLMQPNLNKASSDRGRFVIKEDFSIVRTGVAKKIFLRKIVKDFGAQCHDTFFHEDVPVVVNIEVRLKVNAPSYVKENKYLTNKPYLSDVLELILEGLEGAAFTNRRQIVEVFISKYHGNENRIIVELERV